MNEWGAALLKDLLVTTKDGDWGKAEPTPGHIEYRVIRGTDFARARFGDVKTIPTRYLPERSVHRRTLQAGDVLIETAGGTSDRSTGRTMFVTQNLLDALGAPATCASFARFLRVKAELADPAYVYWYLQNMHARGEMSQHEVRHTGVGRFQYTKFAESQMIPLPPLEIQRAVAATLSALDNKIESNRRVSQEVLSLADALYSAALSRGRRPVRVEDLADFHNRRRVPLSSNERLERPGPIPYYGATGVLSYVDEALFNEVLVLVGEDGSVIRDDGGPVLQYIWGPAWINNHAHPLTGHGISNEALFVALNNADITPIVTGAVQPKVNMRNLKSLVVEVPTDISEFESDLSVLFALYRSKQDEIVQLVAIRNTLLPELLSGRVRVSVGGATL